MKLWAVYSEKTVQPADEETFYNSTVLMLVRFNGNLNFKILQNKFI